MILTHTTADSATDSVTSTIDPSQLATFTAFAADWVNPDGQFKPLHKFNPTRLAYIRDKLCAQFDRDPQAAQPLTGLRLLDIGCGGGLLSEPMARLGADVVGADAAEASITTAALHAAQQGLDIDYRAITAEALVAQGEAFDAILNMEVIEHVADPQAFMTACGQLMKPDAIMFLATLNRTLKAFALAIVGAEYVLRWLPRGTHDWEKFVRPEDLKKILSKNNLKLEKLDGMNFNIIKDEWTVSSDTSINYIVKSIKL